MFNSPFCYWSFQIFKTITLISSFALFSDISRAVLIIFEAVICGFTKSVFSKRFINSSCFSLLKTSIEIVIIKITMVKFLYKLDLFEV